MSCPSCGYCPHCGRHGRAFDTHPYYPYSYPWSTTTGVSGSGETPFNMDAMARLIKEHQKAAEAEDKKASTAGA